MRMITVKRYKLYIYSMIPATPTCGLAACIYYIISEFCFIDKAHYEPASHWTCQGATVAEGPPAHSHHHNHMLFKSGRPTCISISTM